ncbi:hypothetical protein [Spiroplasma chrysopicola]|uniref:Uncharacterized protein n=1 Tax=Spiroplasma chrysopicola DF-1 TaxID=1276227 RepID=R4UH65_9MOLU|nr:hypothetical protein [Spiroplasma chrysopicola]AGM24661.1 hypothetical protein SCHRY_v1c00740 [Spiroplasma chrysopicola DF-1]
MMPSFFIYFALIPVVIFCLIWITIRTIEKNFHRYLNSKKLILLISAIICTVIVIIIIILSFYLFQ